LNSGKRKRLHRIMPDGKTVIVPMDHGVTNGPIKGLVNMQIIVNKLLEGGADAMVIHKGIANAVDTGKAGLIVHLSGSNQFSPDPNLKVRVCSVEEALRIGADAVSVHINVGSNNESEMLEKLGSVADECDEYGVPLLAMMYPRGAKISSEHDPEAVALVARLGAELGADIIKTNYTGDVETFRKVTAGCPVPVIIAGGPKAKTDADVLRMVCDAMTAGGVGVSIGRNVFQNEDPSAMTRALSAIVHRGVGPDEALRILGVKD
jgi:fructose-bisphosphate aldolase/2-amino-3,7-dideoxy-D-threo-hept-6-ulosonate synthase